MYTFNIRQKMWGVILEVTDLRTQDFVNEFIEYPEFDKLHEDTVQNRLLKLEERLRNEQRKSRQ